MHVSFGFYGDWNRHDIRNLQFIEGKRITWFSFKSWLDQFHLEFWHFLLVLIAQTRIMHSYGIVRCVYTISLGLIKMNFLNLSSLLNSLHFIGFLSNNQGLFSSWYIIQLDIFCFMFSFLLFRFSFVMQFSSFYILPFPPIRYISVRLFSSERVVAMKEGRVSRSCYFISDVIWLLMFRWWYCAFRNLIICQ